MTRYRLLYTTWPDAQTAQTAAAQLVEDRLCACVNILPGMTSVYAWEGGIETAAECVALFKTTADAAPALRERITALHPYEEVCVLALPIEAEQSAADFLNWIRASVQATV